MNPLIMKPLKVALCDDNPQEREFFCNVCKIIKDRQNIEIRLKEYDSGATLLFDMEDTRIMTTVDIVLLDIHMPGSDGIEVARKLREFGYQGAIIFITKSNEHWREAFDVEAFNYLTKDADVEKRFINVFLKAAKEAAERRGRVLLFSSIGETRTIEVTSISHFEVTGYLVTVYYGKEKFEFTSSLTKIESLLFGNHDFMRVNRGYIISIHHIEKINEKTKSAVMLNGETVPISPKYMKELKAAIIKQI